jgi:hypothetical protein
MDFKQRVTSTYHTVVAKPAPESSDKNIKRFKNDKGVEFAVRIVDPGEKYGRGFGLTNNEDDPLVEFYDTDYDFDVYGQFVSRYSMSTLLSHRAGLDLLGHEPKWKIDAGTMKHIIRWLNGFHINQI